SAALTVAAPVSHPVDVTISGLVPNTVKTQEAVLAELRAAFLRLGRVAGSDQPRSNMPYLATPATFSLSWIYQAVANADGVLSFDLLAPTVDTALQIGETATLGTVRFV